MRLRTLWKTTFVSDHRYKFHLHNASSKTAEILGDTLPNTVTWILPVMAPATLEEDSESDCESEDDITGDLLAEALKDDENQDQVPPIDLSWHVPVSRFKFLLM
jgi:hypothetical protein